MKLVKIIAISFVALGCGSEPGGVPSEGELAEVDQEIRNGWIDATNTYPDVVAVGIYDAATFEFLGLCSGTLVAPNRVLTAAHCFAGLTSPFVEEVFFDAGFRHGTNLRIHPLYSDATLHYVTYQWLSHIPVTDGPDLATLDLDAPIPLTPRPIATTPPPVGWIMKIVGVGETATGVLPAQRRVGVEVINFFLPLAKGGDFITLNGTMVLTPYTFGNVGCLGDSGAPAINPAGEIVGVLSTLAWEDDAHRCNTAFMNSFSTTHDIRAWILLPPGTPLPYHNEAQPADVNNDNIVTSLDALIVINAINAGTGLTGGSFAYRDTVADNVLTEADAYYVLDYLNNQ